MSLTLHHVEAIAFRRPTVRIAAAAMRHLQAHLASPWSLTAQPDGDLQSDQFRIALQTREPSIPRAMTILVMEFAGDLVLVPTVFLPETLRHGGLMIAALGHMTAEAEALGHRLIICDLVPRYKRSLLARGARTLDAPEAVELHSAMNFQPTSLLAPE